MVHRPQSMTYQQLKNMPWRYYVFGKQQQFFLGGLSSGTVKPGGGFLNSLPPELRRVARQVGGTIKRSIPIGKVFGGKVFPPLTF